MPAVPATEVQEPLHAGGDLDVGARAFLARPEGLSMDSALNGSMLGVHDVLGGEPIITPYG